VGLVAGTETLDHLGSVARHLIVGVLDEVIPVSLICPESAALPGVPAPPVEVVRYGPMRWPLLRRRSLEALLQALAGSAPALLHALDTDALALTRQLAVGLDVNYVVGVLSLARAVRATDPRCRRLLAGSEPIRRHLLATHAASEEVIRLLRPGIHPAKRATCFIDPQHAVAIVAAGALDTFQPFAAVLEAFAQLKAAGRECVFFLVGNGRCERQLRRLAERRGLMGDLTFVDRQTPEQLTGILRAADVFISPAPSRRLEMELLASMAAGVPVLAAGAEAADFIIPDRTALTFTPGDSAELTVKLAALLDDRAAAREMAEAALAHLREHHSPARTASRLAELYRAVAAEPTPL